MQLRRQLRAALPDFHELTNMILLHGPEVQIDGRFKIPREF
jgi:hypothetical protein